MTFIVAKNLWLARFVDLRTPGIQLWKMQIEQLIRGRKKSLLFTSQPIENASTITILQNVPILVPFL
jgi:hypothetical protein